MLTARPARLLGREDHALAVGNPADLVVFEAASPEAAIRTVAPAIMGFKRGRRSFTRPAVSLHRP